ncbi:MAG: hypothetical protein M1834_000832 [Cirrosporium novae-zelandiae]|nr:MAG: hypothetical protein M1834_000832 [Cirrosporium novae-zelandiae]
MRFFQVAAVALAAITQVRGDDDDTVTADDMGPVAFLWPSDRTWSASQDNTAPCGSSAGVGNRTNFPLTGGYVSLVIQDDSWNVEVAVSYDNNPTSNSDFSMLINSSRIAEVEPGHQCYTVSDPASGIGAGTNGTLQLKYTSDFGGDTDNETYYACADIQYISASSFTSNGMCFNVTADEDDDSSSSGSAMVRASMAGTAIIAAVVGLAFM